MRARANRTVHRQPRERPRPGMPWWVPWTGVVAFALVWRLAYLDRLAGTPLLATLRGDERDYWDWATFLLDHGFRGTNPFFQGPLYPYLLAVIRAVSGADVRTVLAVQCVWGATGIGLLTDAARRLVGPAIAIALGLALGVNTMWVFFDNRILTESPLLLLECALVWFWVRHREQGLGDAANGISGLLIGSMAQCRATQAVLLLPHVLLLREQRVMRRGSWVRGALIAAGALVLTAVPSTLWNLSRAHEFIPFTYNGGFNLYVGNNPRANGAFVWVASTRELGSVRAASPDGSVHMDGRDYLRHARGLVLSPGESSGWWAREAARYIGAHPARTGALVLRKLSLMVSRDEVPQIEHLWTFEQLAGPIGVPGLGSFLLLATLGLAGAVFAGRWGPLGVALRVQFVVLVLGTLPFFVTDRYRIHLIPALAMLAAIGVAVALDAVRRRAWREAIMFGTACLVALGIGCLPTGSVDRDYDRWLAESDLGVRWLEVGRASVAAEAFERAIRMESSLPPAVLADTVSRQDRAELHFNYAVALRGLDRDDDTIRQLALAASLDPTNAHVVRTLGDAYRARGRAREADSVLAQVPTLIAGEAELAVSDGYRAAREGRFADAVASFERAVSIDARLYGAWGAMIRAQVLAGDTAVAARTLARARAAGMPPVPLAVYGALVAAARGDSLTAARALERLGTAELDPTQRSVVDWTRTRISSPRRH